ncbi:hypothetical protein [uncultured Campylobacter sp.]|uniref:hypothetical protein n=1 Tax=uncultured Campylobacter sp. TaxID=218934 RepID=UPI00260C453A|nr:hypothetical protein [uncultured Campylobacter sp.]
MPSKTRSARKTNIRQHICKIPNAVQNSKTTRDTTNADAQNSRAATLHPRKYADKIRPSCLAYRARRSCTGYSARNPESKLQTYLYIALFCAEHAKNTERAL